jgi:hypothetical protein
VGVLDYAQTRLRHLAERLPDPAQKVALDNNVDELADHLRSDLECMVHDSLRRTIDELRRLVRATSPDDGESA